MALLMILVRSQNSISWRTGLCAVTLLFALFGCGDTGGQIKGELGSVPGDETDGVGADESALRGLPGYVITSGGGTSTGAEVLLRSRLGKTGRGVVLTATELQARSGLARETHDSE